MKKKIIYASGWGFKTDVFTDVTKHLHMFEHDFIDSTSLHENNNILAGWSLGGLTALQFYKNFPDYFSHIILIASTPRFMRHDDWHGMSDTQAVKHLNLASVDMQKYQQQFLRLSTHPGKHQASKQTAKSYMHPHDK